VEVEIRGLVGRFSSDLQSMTFLGLQSRLRRIGTVSGSVNEIARLSESASVNCRDERIEVVHANTH
jgi:transposase